METTCILQWLYGLGEIMVEKLEGTTSGVHVVDYIFPFHPLSFRALLLLVFSILLCMLYLAIQPLGYKSVQ